MRKGDGAIRDPAMRRARALLMLEHKIRHGSSNVDLAKEFGVSENTVGRILSYARKAELMVEVEDKILQELVPEAHKAILEALSDPEVDKIDRAKIGLEVLQDMLPTVAKKKDASASEGADELSRYIDQFRTGHGIIDGEVAPGAAQRALPPAAEGDSPQGLPAPSDGAGRDKSQSPIETRLGEVFDQGSDGDAA